MTTDIRRLTSDFGHQTSDIRNATSDITRLTSLDIRCLADIRHQPSGIRRLTSDIRRLTSDFGHLTLDYSDQLVSQFLDWTNTNGMPCNPSKCKELTIKKRGNRDLFSPIRMIPSCKEVEILGVTFHCDIKISVHAKNLLSRANKSLYVLRTLGKGVYNQSEIDLLFNTIVVPNINGDHLSTPHPSPILHVYNIS